MAIIERHSKKLLWKFGEGVLGHQHHATALPNGNIQVFNNGLHGNGLPTSSILEINPGTNGVEWQYSASPRDQFFSGHISGAQRLERDNVLICEGTGGRVFEISRTGEVVWEWISPFLHEMTDFGLISWLYRAYRYELGHPAFVGRNLDEVNFAELNKAHGLVV